MVGCDADATPPLNDRVNNTVGNRSDVVHCDVGESIEMITCTIRMTLVAGPRDEALQVLRTLVGPVRSQPGCTQTLLMNDVQNDAIVTWVSRWRRRPDLDRHLRSDHFRRILAVMELAAEPPDVAFENGSELRGLDLIHEVIGGAEDPPSQGSTDIEINLVEKRPAS